MLQVFPMFGASTPQIAMLPLVAVLVMTGIKDGLEDWRRARLDNEVNNSAATKLGSWKNVNQPTDPRSFLERLLGMGNGVLKGRTAFQIASDSDLERPHRRHTTIQRCSEATEGRSPSWYGNHHAAERFSRGR